MYTWRIDGRETVLFSERGKNGSAEAEDRASSQECSFLNMGCGDDVVMVSMDMSSCWGGTPISTRLGADREVVRGCSRMKKTHKGRPRG